VPSTWGTGSAGRAFVDEHGDEPAAHPTWIFSSGPSWTAAAASDAVQIDTITAATNARGHRLFAGRLDKRRLSFGERAVALAFRVAEGDFRDWDEIEAWAIEIGEVLKA
jgi:menaquinone-dependent protoporphyrinogen oxidase